MNIRDKLFYLQAVICIVFSTVQNNGDISVNLLNLKNAFRGMTIHRKIKSYVSDSYYSLINTAIENVAYSGIKTQRTILREEEPIVYEFTRKVNISEAQFKGYGSIENVTLVDSSQFMVTNLTSYNQENEIYFEIYWKNITANDMNYKFAGKILTSISFNGHGQINVKIYNVTVKGKIKYEFENYTIQIKKTQLHYNFDKLELTITGLNISLLSPAGLNKFLSRELTTYLIRNEKNISAEVSGNITKKLNEKLRNFSFFDFIKKLWATLSPSKKEKLSLSQFNDIAELNSQLKSEKLYVMNE